MDAQKCAESFKLGDLVVINLCKSRLPTGSCNKLTNKKLGPSKVLDNIGEIAYRIDLLSYLHINPTFNVVNPYDHVPNSFTLAT